eukprot:CAMPEP_0202370656 /NCGR_PEP_ID=MMETSP1127-20130417/2221_1 /ASSEMBLY_ACC=CAM_ASM_000462 /TAXON_ID=3047 /ORGANISM="Dunaliella tertiolecta, Strain CCMP1320" /LENGTH=790 /DNA_ID=CAMNT_0048966661 /DNA_START=102 /DNA_END=2474 /DNA_ORIENTATION=-
MKHALAPNSSLLAGNCCPLSSGRSARPQVVGCSNQGRRCLRPPARLLLGGLRPRALAAAGPHSNQGDGKDVLGYSIEQPAGLSSSLARAAAESSLENGPVGVLSKDDLERLAQMDMVLLPTDADAQAESSNGSETSHNSRLSHSGLSLGVINGSVHHAANGASHNGVGSRIGVAHGSQGLGHSGMPHLETESLDTHSLQPPLSPPSHSVTSSASHPPQPHSTEVQPAISASESQHQGAHRRVDDAAHYDNLGSHFRGEGTSADASSQSSSLSPGSSLESRGSDRSSSISSSSDAGIREEGPSSSTPSTSLSSSPQPTSIESQATSQPPMGSAPAPPATPSTSTDAPHPNLGRPGHIPKSILVISFVSATLTMASCVFNTLLPIYMVTELRMSMRSMGMFEGLLEAFSYVVRMFSGVVSDMMTSRKSAITLGFAMGACAKFGMSGAATVGQLFASKAVDRLANGVQAAPRDALISDLAPTTSRSACYGFAQSMRKWGSFVGAGLSFFLMKASNNNYKLIFIMAATVSVASTLAFVTLVPSHAREQEAKESVPQQQQQQPPAASQAGSAGGEAGESRGNSAAGEVKPQQQGFQMGQFLKDVLSMGADFYRTLLVICLYGLGHINESMLEARAIEVGFGKAESTLVVALLALMIFFCAYPLGRLDDKYGPRVTFGVGMGALILGDLTLLMSGAHPMALFCSLLFLGVHWAVIQGPMLSIVVGLAPKHLRGTAFGIFYTVMAITAVTANTMFGSVWTALGANAVFGLSAALMGIALLALPSLLPAVSQKPVVAR